MATEDDSADGCCQKLLIDSERATPDEAEEEDCIQLLLDALEKDDTETDGSQVEKGDTETDADIKVYLKKKYGIGTGGSVNDSVSELNRSLLKLDSQTGSNVPPSGAEKTASKRTVPTAVLNRQKLAMKLLKKHNSETGKLVCGIVIILIILGTGVSLLFLAFLLKMEDLYILGGIFSAGGIAFTIAFIVVRCQSREQMEGTDYSVLYKP